MLSPIKSFFNHVYTKLILALIVFVVAGNIISSQNTGSLAAMREKARAAQKMNPTRTSARVGSGGRSTGRMSLEKELAKQAKRDGLDKRTIEEIIDAPADQSDRFTQTEAHLFLQSIRDLIAKTYKVEEYLNVIATVIANEAEHKDTHYAFYNTTSNSWRLAQDLDTRLYARFNSTKVAPDFKFLRFSDEFSINTTAQAFLVKELKEKGLVNDNLWETGALMLSVNLSLFGNVGFPGECSWEYFIKPQGHTAPIRAVYEGMMTKYGLPDKYIDELMSLADIYDTKEDTIVQVLVPIEKVEDIGYLAWVKGIPAHSETIDKILGMSKSKSFLRAIKPNMEKLTETFAKEHENNPLYKSMLESIQAGDFSLNAFLKVYRNKPWELKEINDVTARLLFTPDVLLNPESGVKFFRFSTASHNKLKEYNDRLNAIIEKLVAEKEETDGEESDSSEETPAVNTETAPAVAA